MIKKILSKIDIICNYIVNIIIIGLILALIIGCFYLDYKWNKKIVKDAIDESNSKKEIIFDN